MSTATSGTLEPHLIRNGVITLYGFGLSAKVERGHLLLEDGIGSERRSFRIPRVGHGLKRLVCISEDGFVTLSALKWLSDLGVSLLMLDRTGKVLFVTGPTASSDSRVRHAQSLSLGNGRALAISKELISAKLRGQESLIRERMKNGEAADTIAGFRARISEAENFDALRLLEAHSAIRYWNSWRDVPVLWPKSDLGKIPSYWSKFGTRASPLSGGPRLAINPPNALLNYLFALLESESRLALVALGIDPGIGFLHPARAYRDSLALDLMEATRPDVERWLYQWITTEPLRRSDFYETGNGNCRLMANLCEKLSETVPTWRKLVAPWAEFVARTLSSTIRGKPVIATRLTQRNKRDVHNTSMPPVHLPLPEHVCSRCGTKIGRGKKLCHRCWESHTKKEFESGRRLAQKADAIAKRSETMLQHRREIRNWKPSDLPTWLTRDVYMNKVLPSLSKITKSQLCTTLGICEPYASFIQTGKRIPHPRHWHTLFVLAGIPPIAD